MLRKIALLSCLLSLLVTSQVSHSEEFHPYHPGAFSGFWIKRPVVNIATLVDYPQGKARHQLWSDDYWARYAGGLAYRYAAPGFWLDPKKPRPNDWKIPSEHILKKSPAAELIRSGRTNVLSPAEKYDLLVNDPNYTLTKAFLSEITPKTQPWEGSCDGWAFASINEKPPVKSVTVKNVKGQAITFYPSDIRGLLTLLYSDYRIASFGSDCYDKWPAADGAGRLREAGCRDTNPGIFHTVLVNQVGIGQRGFVMDSDYAAETWNYPIKSYSMQYFNPQTNNSYQDPLDAAITKQAYTRDRFARHRSENVHYIIGVQVMLEYQTEAFPQVAHRLEKSYERSFNTNYRYDLELDVDGNVIGGEWHQTSQRNHPDLISFVGSSYVNKTPYDKKIWGRNLPEILRSVRPQYARAASAKRRPLFKVVKALAKLSQE